MKSLLHNVLDTTASLYPEKMAVMATQNLTFTDVQEQSNRVAAYLQQTGVKRGDRVVILLGNAFETIISFWAIMKAGAIVIPVGTELTSDKIAYILKDSGATVLVTTEEIATQNKTLLQDASLNKVLVPNKTEALAGSLYENFQTAIDTTAVSLQPSGVISVDLAAIIYTSGSTGEPKGVMLTHDNMVAATNSLNAYLGYRKEDKVLCALPLSFDYGLYQMIMSISTGATLVLEKEFTWPIFLLKKIVKEKITVLPAVPTMVMMLHEQNKKQQLDLSSIRSVTNTGAALTPTNIDMIKAMFPNTAIFSMYGLTECKRCTYLPPQDIDRKPNSVGIAIPNTELWLIDEDGAKVTEPNQIGQLVIRGATVMKGYWKKPEKTAQKLKDGPIPGQKVLHTGDFCSLDEEGYLYFQGRMDHMIKSRGIKVSPKEVEDFIGTLPEINASVITGVPHKDYGEVLFAFVVLKNDQSLTEEEIKTACKANLEAYKVPEHIRIISSIPKTPNGKFDVITLKEKALQEASNPSKILTES